MTNDIEADDGGLLLIPNIGDHVVFLRAADGGGTKQIEAVVENRLFLYLAPNICTVNIVVTDSEVDTGRLIKE
ncbi:MAG: hypothetical protein WA993_15405 [Candidatus Binatus sp.]